MPNARLKDWEDALVTAIDGEAISGVSEVRAITPLDVTGLLRVGRPKPNGIYITTAEEPFNDMASGGDSRLYDVIYETDIIIIAPIREDAVGTMRDDLMTIADAARDAVVNQVLVTTPFRAFPVGMRAPTQYRQHLESGFVSATVRVYSGMQFNG